MIMKRMHILGAHSSFNRDQASDVAVECGIPENAHQVRGMHHYDDMGPLHPTDPKWNSTACFGNLFMYRKKPGYHAVCHFLFAKCSRDGYEDGIPAICVRIRKKGKFLTVYTHDVGECPCFDYK